MMIEHCHPLIQASVSIPVASSSSFSFCVEKLKSALRLLLTRVCVQYEGASKALIHSKWE
jgi:hypothetical protein